MPDKASVAVVFRIERGGGSEEFSAGGTLHRLAAGWAVTCRLTERTGGAEETGVSDMMLIVRESEIRMNRKGAVKQNQVFRTGEWRAGTIGTEYGTLDAEAYTHRIRMNLSPSGGCVEWEYDLRLGEDEFGRSLITLDIREEQTK